MMILKSMRARLTATFSFSLAILVLAAVCGLIWYSKHSAERGAESLLATISKRVVYEGFESSERRDPNEMIEELGEDLRGSNLALSVIDPGGRIIGKSQKHAPDQSSMNDSNWRVSAIKLKNGNIVIIGMPWAKTRNTLRYHAITLIYLGVFVVVIASAGAWFLIGRALRPIPLLARQANASSTDNPAISLKAPSQDYEMVELVNTLNGLLCRVTETAAAKGRFYSAASHELRTPLQALSGHLELALSKDRTREEYKATAEEAYAQTRRLISLIRALLFLYQLDSSTTLPPSEPVNLVDVCSRSLQHFKSTIEERSLNMNMQAPDEAGMLTPPSHIDMLVRNLIENAVKYTPEHGRMDIAIIKDQNNTQLNISNDCSEALSLVSDQIFEPFSRPDSSRNSKTGGTGLGLAICKSIADANGWRFDIVAQENRVRANLIIPYLQE